jgi:hypothetical protein
MPQKDVIRLLKPSVLRQFDDLTTTLMLAVGKVVGDRVLEEAIPMTVPEEYLETAKMRTEVIVKEEVERAREICQKGIREGMPM